MIQANELRIGNLVNYKWFDKTYVLIDGCQRQKTIIHREVLSVLAVDGENKRALIKTKQHRKNQTWVSLNKLTPTPLTEEMLLKCGFEKCTGKYGAYFKHQHASLMRIWQHESYDKYVWVVGKKLEELQETIIVSEICNHLHQLQNLYFALIGQELEINI